jgi:hypothetical protein
MYKFVNINNYEQNMYNKYYRPDIVVQVFRARLNKLIHNLKQGKNTDLLIFMCLVMN